MNYLDAFFDLKCAREILDIIGPLNNTGKEISESMSIVAKAKRVLLKDRYTVFDLCAGNGLTSTLISFLFPLVSAVAIDIRRPDRDWSKIRRFSYIQKNLYEVDADHISKISTGNAVLISVHPCTELAKKAVKLFNQTASVEWLFLMPCCSGMIDARVVPASIENFMGNYMAWVYQLFHELNAPYKNIYVDDNNLSEKNAIIVGSKSGSGRMSLQE